MAKRSLTSGEIALARGLFGTSLDYHAIGVFDRGYARINALGNMSFRGNIFLPHGHDTDFSMASIARQRLFIHETVHVWQHQNRVLNLAVAAWREARKHRFRYGRAYLFLLDRDKDLLDYGLEQQPAIIEEYFLRQHSGVSMGRCLNRDADIPALLEAVLGRFLHDPGYARRGVERTRTAGGGRIAPVGPVRAEAA
ncbi:hypothetical protein NFI95_06150 [Acetobacteraceae bacterium KSS8]|uniref:Type IV secretion protein Rhs n=1 Tax=Endosaccharibacter trunci TaxID=2812733 RepID=A0ABT1W7A5_9PROT|nr:hypothetical protein [Acetobacteraceae bacterium KSS8]